MLEIGQDDRKLNASESANKAKNMGESKVDVEDGRSNIANLGFDHGILLQCLNTARFDQGVPRRPRPATRAAARQNAPNRRPLEGQLHEDGRYQPHDDGRGQRPGLPSREGQLHDEDGQSVANQEGQKGEYVDLIRSQMVARSRPSVLRQDFSTWPTQRRPVRLTCGHRAYLQLSSRGRLMALGSACVLRISVAQTDQTSRLRTQGARNMVRKAHLPRAGRATAACKKRQMCIRVTARYT
jgi:hypothetical protein